MKIYIMSGFIILIGLFTVLFIWLKFIDLAYSEENDKIILVAAIGLIGAIVGGAISGTLTLAGVYLTIRHDKEEKFMVSFPFRKRSADLVENDLIRRTIYSMHMILEKNCNYEEIIEIFNGRTILSERIILNYDDKYEEIIEILEVLEEKREEILDYATKVDGYYFSRISDIMMNCHYIKVGLIALVNDGNVSNSFLSYANNEIINSIEKNICLIKEIREHIEQMTQKIS
ncbi:hypothetical protein MPH47_04210 [Psychrobacillus psychrodurans]|uniref:hypothetical protein n=1 Tax=Psychrobacillus psychrodurans TaxID=126157 RepID=UPI001F4EBADB|nr:hypothetical protein [Psychrobacillus psychrodurans]MCK1996449.1 hypothetical protein [Psychrobacillus psychrodurans]